MNVFGKIVYGLQVAAIGLVVVFLGLAILIGFITLMAQVNNLFNSAYESNGGNWMCLFTDGTRYDTPWYYAQAGINVHGGLIVRW